MIAWSGHPRSPIPESLKSLNSQTNIQCLRQKMIKCLKEPGVARAPTRPAQCAGPTLNLAPRTHPPPGDPLNASGQPARFSSHTQCLTSSITGSLKGSIQSQPAPGFLAGI